MISGANLFPLGAALLFACAHPIPRVVTPDVARTYAARVEARCPAPPVPLAPMTVAIAVEANRGVAEARRIGRLDRPLRDFGACASEAVSGSTVVPDRRALFFAGVPVAPAIPRCQRTARGQPSLRSAEEERLERAAIQAVIRARVADVERCFRRGLGASSVDVEARLTLRFVIGADGRIGDLCSPVPTALPWLDACVAGVFAAMTFAAPSDTVVTYPFVFRTR